MVEKRSAYPKGYVDRPQYGFLTASQRSVPANRCWRLFLPDSPPFQIGFGPSASAGRGPSPRQRFVASITQVDDPSHRVDFEQVVSADEFFRASSSLQGFARSHEYVDLKASELGCDTIFLLSDGAPSWDDFARKDKYYKGEGKIVRDTEYGIEVPPTDLVNYPGPYVFDTWLAEDVKRMNVFRKAQIHCIGIGEANVSLLRQIAKAAMGEVYLLGAKAKKAGGVK